MQKVGLIFTLTIITNTDVDIRGPYTHLSFQYHFK